jgi:tetratricopeptide (TPR) repeat protein/DNA-binding winged helix-turn-helix (wHTH) protein
MATAEEVVGYEFYRGFYADIEGHRVLRKGEPLPAPLTLKEFEVLEFFLKNPKKLIARKAVEPLDKPAMGRQPVDNYLSRITGKLGLEKEELFKPTRRVGYSFEANVRPIFASDQQDGGDIFKASELNFNTHTIDSMRASLRQSLRALEINPYGLPGAHVTAAYDYINLSQAAYSAEPPHKVIPKARQHAMEALKNHLTSSRALGVLGLISMIYDHDWEKAKTQLEGALESNPDDAATSLSYAHFLVGSGRLDEAVKAVEKAVRIDPTDLIIHASVGRIHLFAGDVRGAIELGEKTTFLYPGLPAAYGILGWAYEAAERYADARRHYEISLEKEYSPAALASLGHLRAKLGDRHGGLAALEEMDHLHKRGSISYLPSYYRALVFVGLNEVEECLDALEHAYEQHCDWLIHLAVERRWDPVRRSTRFKQLVQRIGVTVPSDLTLGAQS